ncbi:MAG TPA: MATE family efflux transporter [Gammaproteobacteria bacterium]|nr:MATE family efflux transporter [Gammaproteobacteria bacterium]
MFTPRYASIWAVSWPLIVAGVSETVVEVTDAIFLGHYGVTELAAVGLAGSIYAVALAFTLGLVDAVQIVVGRRVGEDDASGVGASFNQGMYLLALASLALIAALEALVPPFTAIAIASPPLRLAVDAYLEIAAFGVLFHAFNLAYSAFYVGISRTRVLIGATLLLAGANVALDYALIFGHWGLPELGIAGAGAALVGAEALVFLFLTGHVLVRRYARDYGLLRFGRWRGGIARHLVALGTPVSLDALVETGRWFLFFLIIEALGREALAVATIVFSCYAVFMIPVDALSESVCSMVSNLIGQQRGGQARVVIRRASLLSLAGVLPVLLLAGLFPHAVVGLFTERPEMTAPALPSLAVVMAATLVAVPAEAYYAAVAGTGDTWAALVIQLLVSIVVVGAAALAALVFDLSLPWVWSAELAGMLACLVAARARFGGGAWRRLRV